MMMLGLLLFAVLMVLVFVVTWRGTRGMGDTAKVLTRGGVGILTVLPLVMLAVMSLSESVNTTFDKIEGALPPAEDGASGAPPAPKLSRKKPAKPAAVPPPSPAPSAPGTSGTTGVEPGAAGPPPDAAMAPPPPMPPEEPTPTPTPPTTSRDFALDDEAATRGLGGIEEEAAEEAPEEAAGAPAPAAANGERDAKWDIVPVYYGTDRERSEDTERLNYDDRRGRRLELGRALVTVPKSHTIPQIERPWTLRIPIIGIEIGESENPEEHFTMKEIKALSEAELLALVAERLAKSQRYKKHALIFVHGFNTTFDFAIYRTAQIAYDLKFDGAPFAYSWPSGGGVLNYTYDSQSSGQAQPFLKDFINMVLNKTGADAVSLIAHSMGNQPTLQVLKDLKASKPDGVIFHQIILAAPDVDRDIFENIANDIKGLAKGMTLYAAKNDKALAISRNVNGGVPRAGDVSEQGPLILEGVDTIDVTSVSTDSFGLNHSGYAENNDLLQDVKALIATGVRPPERRISTTKPILQEGQTYWEFRPPAQ